MNTPTARNAMSHPTQQTSEVHAQPSDVASKGETDSKNAIAGAELSSPVERETALARVPKGPFKILTIPQSWYDSLHAAPTTAGDAGKERG